MEIAGLIWLRDVVEKLIRKHHVRPVEVEEVLGNAPRFRRIARGNVAGENLYVAMGRSDAGRYLAVFFVFKQSHDIIVITARDK